MATVLIGILLTATASWAADRADESSERRLLETQAKQAAAVLSTAIFVIEQPLTTALQVQAAAGPDGNPSVFRRTFAVSMGEEALFVTASLWHKDPRGFEQLAAVGAQPGIEPQTPRMQDLLGRALDTSTSVVQRVEVGDRTRIAYARADPETGFVVYTERAIPKNRRARVDSDSAYANIHYAIYLGEETTLGSLTTTDMDPADLPLGDPTYATTIPFGDTVLTLVVQPTDHLGSPLGRHLPALLLIGGLLLTFATALIARQLFGARLRAEADATTINDLYEQVHQRYDDEREMSLRLQRALLPQVNPSIPELEIASRYVAGTQDIEIGGDWYSVIELGEHHFGFVVGDVSGHGIDAVATMARARFTLRAYLLDGNAPHEALAKASRQFDVAEDGHIVTAVVGLGDRSTGEVTFANAGHPLPLVLAPEGSVYVPMPVGPPLGVGTTDYEPATFTVPVGATLLAYTDGLVERRTEDIELGMQRLLDAADHHADEQVTELLSSLLEDMRSNEAPDDIALLALHRLATNNVS
ncbi:PP2C family protein-serine/threonine phosphatase [Nocardioides humilatus]|uniref:PP2C family protein-serine/threonine phosphatase n=1 Tax=Nocardioides humilatus TaxID=2607660 RepID=UPI00165F41FE|nr:PP2C family protein-serine/threonine phosphatase [Nocardioides humilatus]